METFEDFVKNNKEMIREVSTMIFQRAFEGKKKHNAGFSVSMELADDYIVEFTQVGEEFERFTSDVEYATDSIIAFFRYFYSALCVHEEKAMN